MPLSLVASSSQYTDTIAIPSHQAGDLIVVFAYRNNTASSPTLATGWTNITNAAGSSNGFRLGYRVDTDNSVTSSSKWNGAYFMIVHIYRGIDATPIGQFATTLTTSGSSVNYSGLTLDDSDGSSWVAAFIGHRNGEAALTTTSPSGMTNVEFVTSTAGAASHHTNGGVTSWSGGSVTYNAVGTNYNVVVEIRGDGVASGGFAHLDTSGAGLVNAAAGSGNYLELSNSGYIRRTGTEGVGSLILDASGNIITKS